MISFKVKIKKNIIIRSFSLMLYHILVRLSGNWSSTDFQKSPSSDLKWRGTSRDFVARLAASQPKKLALLAKKLVRSTCSKSGSSIERKIKHRRKVYNNTVKKIVKFNPRLRQILSTVFSFIGICNSSLTKCCCMSLYS